MHNFFTLESIGASADVYAAFAPHSSQGLTLGRVAVAIRDQYRILTASGESHAEASGALLYMAAGAADLPAVGDWVAARAVSSEQAIIQAVLPRRTWFSRRAAGNREDEQIIAANVDTVFLVTALDHDFNLRRMERYLTLARESGADPVIVLNKADLCDDIPAFIGQIRRIAVDTPVVAISAKSGGGIAPILPFLGDGRTIALLGSSGVGKSTLLNRIIGGERQRTQEVRESDSRGRHTTTHRELIPLEGGGAVIDNPGMRELQLWASQGSLDGAFGDIAKCAEGCHFADCTHESEPGCAVRAALEDGSLDADRWASYLKLRAEVRYHERKTDPEIAAAVKQKWKSIHKAMRSYKKHW